MTKGNNGTGNNISRDDWETPNNLFKALNDQYMFNFDCCATIENSKCEFWHDDFLKVGIEEAGLKEHEVAWMNPPFSKAEKMIMHFFEVVDKGVAIYRCDNIETELWHFILKNADWVHIIKGRTNYIGHEGKGARFGSALFGIGVEPPKNIKGITLNKFA